MSHPFQQKEIGEILFSLNYISREDLHKVSSSAEVDVGLTLAKNNLITDKQYMHALSVQSGIEYIDLENVCIDKELFEILPAVQAFKFNVLPLKIEEDTLSVVVSDPYDTHIEKKLENICGSHITLLISDSSSIRRALENNQGEKSVLDKMSGDLSPVIVKESDEGSERIISLGSLEDFTSPAIKLINSIIVNAISQRASDIHVETYSQGILVKYRVDGVLTKATELIGTEHHSSLISRIKVMAELDISEKRTPQDGRFRLRFKDRDIDFRISILPSIHGEDVVIRILDRNATFYGNESIDLSTIGLPSEMLGRIRRMVNEPHGMVLITGPTGSGKTTTLYAAISELDVLQEKVITIEDPVEYILNGVTQIQVNEKKGLTFATGLRSILRHDPDKIMVGEIRDNETAGIAIQSALTGHLVYSTVHANGVFDVIERFLNMNVDIYSFVTAVNCIISQRLVRQICNNCKTKICDDTLIQAFGFDLSGHPNAVWYEGRGCQDCNKTGYRGRFAILEMLEMNDILRQMFIDRKSITELQVYAREHGMKSIREAGLEKAAHGLTSLQEINRVTITE